MHIAQSMGSRLECAVAWDWPASSLSQNWHFLMNKSATHKEGMALIDQVVEELRAKGTTVGWLRMN